ncbi:hypothetical protein AA313_de0209332 [Arthrobotrys entomopaga]|nr:hypothetical protein AA313_de0209332 [Arthrobotrys entomopaga]
MRIYKLPGFNTGTVVLLMILSFTSTVHPTPFTADSDSVPPPPPTSKNPTSSSKPKLFRRVQAVPFEIECKTKEEALESWLTRYDMGEEFTNTPNYYDMLHLEGRDRVLGIMRWDIKNCLECGCADEELDEANPDVKGLRRWRYPGDEEGCEDFLVDECHDIYGCFCRLPLPNYGSWAKQKLAIKGDSIRSIQERINAGWVVQYPETGGDNQGEAGGSGAGGGSVNVHMANHRRIVPYVKEPYWIEGPDLDKTPTFNFLSGLGGGFKGGLFKRDEREGEESGKADGGDGEAKDAATATAAAAASDVKNVD